MRRLVRSLMLGTALMSLGGALPIAAAPITMGFTPIPFPVEGEVDYPISPGDQAALEGVSDQFSVTIDFVDAPQFILDIDPDYTKMVSFTFSNVGPVGSRVAEIYWDWSTDPAALLDPTLPPPGGFYDDPSGEIWLLSAPTGPNGNVNPWTFPTFSAEAGGDGAGRGNAAGLSNTDAATTFYMGLGTYPEGSTDPDDMATWDMITGALQRGDIQFGLHVISIATFLDDDGHPTSYHFNSVPYVEPNDDDPNPVVPVPAGAGLGFLGMALVGVARRKKG